MKLVHKREHKVVGREVGDDIVNFSKSNVKLAIGVSAAEKVFKMEVSREDTFVSGEAWNFCEST